MDATQLLIWKIGKGSHHLSVIQSILCLCLFFRAGNIIWPDRISGITYSMEMNVKNYRLNQLLYSGIISAQWGTSRILGGVEIEIVKLGKLFSWHIISYENVEKVFFHSVLKKHICNLKKWTDLIGCTNEKPLKVALNQDPSFDVFEFIIVVGHPQGYFIKWVAM